MILGSDNLTVTMTTSTGVVELPVIDSEISLEETRQPYAVAELTCPLTDAVLALDPQAEVIKANLLLTRTLGRVDRWRDVSSQFRSLLWSDMTAAANGAGFAGLSAGMYHDYAEPGREFREQAREMRMHLRARNVDEKAGTVRLTIASHDARLYDDAHIGDGPLPTAAEPLLAVVNNRLGRIGHDVLIWDGVGEGLPIPEDEEREWPAGESLADFLNSYTRTAGARLYCDEAGFFHLERDQRDDGPGLAIDLYGGEAAARSITQASHRSSRDEGWYTAVVLTYRWTDANGDAHERLDYAADPLPAPARVWTQTLDRPWPGRGRAAAMLRTLRRRGKSIAVEAVSDYIIAPGQRVRVHLPNRPAYVGRVAAVSFRTPADEMTLTLRDLEEAT